MNTYYLLAFYLIIGIYGEEETQENITIIRVAPEEMISVSHGDVLMLQKLPVRMISVFGSLTITANSTERFFIEFSNSTDVTEEPLWWRAFFLKESHTDLMKKLSPFEILYFQIKFVDPETLAQVKLHVHFTAFDLRNVGWFIAGILLFFVAKSLSRSVIFHYTSGASIGMLMSWMIVLMLLYKLIPYRRAMTALVVTGTGAGFYFTEMVFTKGYQLVLQYPYEAAAICTLFGSISMALIYYFGPPSTEKSFNLIQWSLQLAAVYMIYQSSYCKEFSITAIITVGFLQFISLYTVLVRLFILVTPRRFYYWYNRPVQRRFLTLEEYEEQGVVETAKALKDLSDYCSSPECNSWRVVSRLNDPKRFAKYLTDNEHFTREELDSYDAFEVMEEDDRLDFDAAYLSETDSAVVMSRGGSTDWLTDDETRGSSMGSI